MHFYDTYSKIIGLGTTLLVLSLCGDRVAANPTPSFKLPAIPWERFNQNLKYYTGISVENYSVSNGIFKGAIPYNNKMVGIECAYKPTVKQPHYFNIYERMYSGTTEDRIGNLKKYLKKPIRKISIPYYICWITDSNCKMPLSDYYKELANEPRNVREKRSDELFKHISTGALRVADYGWYINNSLNNFCIDDAGTGIIVDYSSAEFVDLDYSTRMFEELGYSRDKFKRIYRSPADFQLLYYTNANFNELANAVLGPRFTKSREMSIAIKVELNDIVDRQTLFSNTGRNEPLPPYERGDYVASPLLTPVSNNVSPLTSTPPNIDVPPPLPPRNKSVPPTLPPRRAQSFTL
ncbi:hypothetical protein BDF22DRAFT_700869 [Syncephalis plumigaleata]|nr:hypothetical protein BDF22DRAFT_700869 [Syncephalis plumigaleata]